MFRCCELTTRELLLTVVLVLSPPSLRVVLDIGVLDLGAPTGRVPTVCGPADRASTDGLTTDGVPTKCVPIDRVSTDCVTMVVASNKSSTLGGK